MRLEHDDALSVRGMSKARVNGTADTTIADTLAGADQLSVLADKLEEISTVEVTELAAAAAGDAYRIAALALESRGHVNNAREAWVKARDHYKRGAAPARAQIADRRARANRPPNGNYYTDDFPEWPGAKST